MSLVQKEKMDNNNCCDWSGSWGTALSQVLNDNGHEVRIWRRITGQIDEINRNIQTNAISKTLF